MAESRLQIHLVRMRRQTFIKLKKVTLRSFLQRSTLFCGRSHFMGFITSGDSMDYSLSPE
jgi:hypothetical protein